MPVVGPAGAVHIAFLNEQNVAALDYYLLPGIDISLPRLKLAEHNGMALDSYRFESLAPLFAMAERMKLGRAA